MIDKLMKMQIDQTEEELKVELDTEEDEEDTDDEAYERRHNILEAEEVVKYSIGLIK